MRALHFGTWKLAALVAGCLLALGCGGPPVGELPTNDLILTVKGLASDPSVAALGEAQGGLGVTRAFVSVSALSFMPCLADAGDVTLDARGYALLQDPPPSEFVTTAVTKWCGLRVDLDPVSENATDGVPEGASLYVEGQTSAGEPFALSSDSSTSLLFEADSGSSFGTLPLLLGFDASVWLAGLPLPEDAADAAKELFDAQLRESASLYVDANGNQLLDDDEQTPVARASMSR